MQMQHDVLLLANIALTNAHLPHPSRFYHGFMVDQMRHSSVLLMGVSSKWGRQPCRKNADGQGISMRTHSFTAISRVEAGYPDLLLLGA